MRFFCYAIVSLVCFLDISMTIKTKILRALVAVFVVMNAALPLETLAAGAPVIIHDDGPRSYLQSDGTSDVLLTMVTNRATDMQVMVCEGKILSGDPAECTWHVRTATVRNHRMVVEGLLPSTTYSYRVQLTDYSTGLAVTVDHTFATR
jgi:hypothetical protein